MKVSFEFVDVFFLFIQKLFFSLNKLVITQNFGFHSQIDFEQSNYCSWSISFSENLHLQSLFIWDYYFQKVKVYTELYHYLRLRNYILICFKINYRFFISNLSNIFNLKASVYCFEDQGSLIKTIIEFSFKALNQTYWKLRYFFHFGNWIFVVQNQRQHNSGVSNSKSKFIDHLWNLGLNYLEFLKIDWFMFWFLGNQTLLYEHSRYRGPC